LLVHSQTILGRGSKNASSAMWHPTADHCLSGVTMIWIPPTASAFVICASRDI
jgi:hypothetical protein